MMEESCRLFRYIRHLEFTDVEHVHLRQIHTATLLDVTNHGFSFFLGCGVARQQLAQASIRSATIDFGHQVNQEFRLSSVMRGITVDGEKSHQAVNKIVDGGCEVGAFFVSAPPTAQVESIIFVFFQRRGIEHANYIFAHPYSFYAFVPLASGAPIQRIHILKDGEHSLLRKLFPQDSRQVPGREMGFSKKDKNDCIGMAFSNLSHLVDGVTIARANLAEIFPRHAIKAVDGFAMLTRGYQQIVERRPVISPIEIKANALPEFLFIDFAAPPLVEDMLIAGKDRLDSQNNGRSPGCARCSNMAAANAAPMAGHDSQR